MGLPHIVLLTFCSALLLSLTAHVRAQTHCDGLSHKEKIQRAPIIFMGRKEPSHFHVISAYKGLIKEGADTPVQGSETLVPGHEYVVFARKNTAGDLTLDTCATSFERTSISTSTLSAEILAELEIFKAQLSALEDLSNTFIQGPGDKKSWALEMGALLQEYGDYEKALNIYKQQIHRNYNYIYNRAADRMEKRQPALDPFTVYESAKYRRGPPLRYDGIREELKQAGIVLIKLGRYEEALTPLEMALESGMGADTEQLYFETILNHLDKEYFNGKKIRLRQRSDMPNYEVFGADLSNIKITLNHIRDTTFNSVNFSGSDLSGSIFDSSVIFKSTNFTNANLDGIKFKHAKYDKKTIWPKNFIPEEHDLVPYIEGKKGE